MTGYGSSAYGTSTYGAGTSGAYGPITITAGIGSASASGLPAAVAVSLVVDAGIGSAAAAGLPARVRLTPILGAYDLDDNSSQALNIRVDLTGVLVQQPKVTAPPGSLTEDGISLLRVSPVMPTPTLDSNGRPT